MKKGSIVLTVSGTQEQVDAAVEKSQNEGINIPSFGYLLPRSTDLEEKLENSFFAENML